MRQIWPGGAKTLPGGKGKDSLSEEELSDEQKAYLATVFREVCTHTRCAESIGRCYHFCGSLPAASTTC